MSLDWVGKEIMPKGNWKLGENKGLMGLSQVMMKKWVRRIESSGGLYGRCGGEHSLSMVGLFTLWRL